MTVPEATLLLIDPNEKMRQLLGDHLRTRGYDLTGVPHGLDAARQLRQGLPDLVLIDQSVPMGGMKTARLLRLYPRY